MKKSPATSVISPNGEARAVSDAERITQLENIVEMLVVFAQQASPLLREIANERGYGKQEQRDTVPVDNPTVE